MWVRGRTKNQQKLPLNLRKPSPPCSKFGTLVLWLCKHFRKFWARWLVFGVHVSQGWREVSPLLPYRRGKLVKQRHELFACSWGGKCVILTAEKEMVLYRLLVTEKANACLLLLPHHWSDCWVDTDQYPPFLLTPLVLHIFTSAEVKRFHFNLCHSCIAKWHARATEPGVIWLCVVCSHMRSPRGKMLRENGNLSSAPSHCGFRVFNSA